MYRCSLTIHVAGDVVGSSEWKKRQMVRFWGFPLHWGWSGLVNIPIYHCDIFDIDEGRTQQCRIGRSTANRCQPVGRLTSQCRSIINRLDRKLWMFDCTLHSFVLKEVGHLVSVCEMREFQSIDWPFHSVEGKNRSEWYVVWVVGSNFDRSIRADRLSWDRPGDNRLSRRAIDHSP